MTRHRRTNFELSPVFKAKVALEAIAGEMTQAQISAMYGVHISQVTAWKKELIQHAPAIWGDEESLLDLDFMKAREAKDISWGNIVCLIEVETRDYWQLLLKHPKMPYRSTVEMFTQATKAFIKDKPWTKAGWVWKSAQSPVTAQGESGFKQMTLRLPMDDCQLIRKTVDDLKKKYPNQKISVVSFCLAVFHWWADVKYPPK